MTRQGGLYLNLFLLLLCLSQVQAQGPKAAPYSKPSRNRDAKVLPDCSTLKVNGDCKLVFDRLVPISPPNIQMHPGAQIVVFVSSPLEYETLSLDPGTFQIVVPSDQAQGLAAAIIPSLKGVAAPSVFLSQKYSEKLSITAADSGDVAAVKTDLKNLNDAIDQRAKTVAGTVSAFITQSRGFYAQIAEAVAPLPRPEDAAGNVVRVSDVPPATPLPWTHYYQWRSFLIYELSSLDCTAESGCSNPVAPPFKDLIVTGIDVGAKLTPPPPPTGSTLPTLPSFFASDDRVSTVLKTTNDDIAKLTDSDKKIYQVQLTQTLELVTAITSPWLTTVTAINKDLQTYFVNIKEINAPRVASKSIGTIQDPFSTSGNTGSTTNFLGRTVTYSVNAVNQIAVTTTAVATTTQKTPIASISVLYADPIFEVSTGAFFSTIPSRTFSNMTQVTGHTGTMISTGNVVITESTIRPTVIPYAAGNWRIGPNFLVGQRRAAVYFTTAVGFNAYNTTAEYAVGPSLAYRNIMISPLLHIGHDIRLTQGETVGEILCSTAPGASNACVGSPPPPSTKYYWRTGFALGIGIRIPTSFGTTTGR